MNPLAVVTVVRGRRRHLELLHRGLERSTSTDLEWVVVAMDDPDLDDWAPAGAVVPLVTHVTLSPDGHLPLAAARNAGARRALARGATTLVFLDVDCIPASGLVDSYRSGAESPRTASTLMCGPVSYLPPAPPGGYDLTSLDSLAAPHPARPAPAPGEVLLGKDHDLFWSLSFAVRAELWRDIGGFCERYEGYGGEDTDFAAKARARGIGLSWIGGARSHHQHHPTQNPPTQHVTDILRNARVFHDRWGRWPMQGWLDGFVDRGLLVRNPDGYDLPP